MVIFDAGLEEGAIRAVLDRAAEVIRARGGEPGRVDLWGKRRFAYEVKHRHEGFYVVLQATAPPAAMAELDRMLLLTDEVLRHKVIRLPEAAVGRSLRPAAEGEPAAVAAETTGAQS
jgi:small subunit ribosomal protein S6